jgi:hypothetical protein
MMAKFAILMLGMFIGAILGMTIMSFCVLAGDLDETEEKLKHDKE